MACTSCNESSVVESPPTAMSLSTREVFEAFWPKQFTFPPIAPYLAATVTRPQAFAWMKALAPLHQEMLSGDPSAVLDFIGKAMMGDGEYRRVRKKSKPKPKPSPGPYVPPYDPTDGPRSMCWRAAIEECGSYGNVMYMDTDGGGCRYRCIDGAWDPDDGGDGPQEPLPSL